MSFELQINFRMIDVVRQDKKYAPIIQSRFSLNIFYFHKSDEKGLVTSYNNIICCPLPSICTHILSQEATLQYNITLNVEHVG